ncbi:hypothetical protein B9Z19DRAFT_983212 [Tuber borchii]|uniref:Mitochondrial zinc maintenance protein 1, mitochondrial n=1 Tax=Tuber borchii TaxID=42251 RepID=A0A2T6ZSN0_TUBBO|nr:hypothetical protein B9Z19DRAFT_983212 [Tuber borchii]
MPPQLLHPTRTPPQAYLTLLRAARLAFGNDTKTLTAAQARIRHEFRHTPAERRDEGVRKALEAAKILRENVVQGVMEEGQEGVFRLNIHDEIERGDNERDKFGGGKCREG